MKCIKCEKNIGVMSLLAIQMNSPLSIKCKSCGFYAEITHGQYATSIATSLLIGLPTVFIFVHLFKLMFSGGAIIVLSFLSSVVVVMNIYKMILSHYYNKSASTLNEGT